MSKRKSELECAYCGMGLDSTEAVLFCPSCGREGCPECMPAGRGCECPECEEGVDE